MKKKFSKALAVILSILMLLSAVPLMAFAAYPVEYYYPDGTVFVSGIAFSRKDYFGSLLNINDLKENLNNAGYNALDNDFNKGCGTGSDWIAGGWKTSTDITQALRDIKFYFSGSSSVSSYIDRTVNGRSVRYYLVGSSYEPNSVSGGGVVDLNGGAGGAYIYAYVTRDPAAGPPITGIIFNYTQNETGRGYTACTRFDNVNLAADLNDGKGDASYMHWTSNTSVVNTANLRSVYSLADNMISKKTNYTIESYRSLESAYNNTKPVIENLNKNGAATASQSTINTLYNNLYNAVYGAQTNLYFNAANNGGLTDVKQTTVTIGPADSVAVDVSGFTATKGNWDFLGWNLTKNATSANKNVVNVGCNSTVYAIFGKDVSASFSYIQDDGAIKNEQVNGTIYNTSVSSVVNAPAAGDVVYNDDALTFLGWRDDAIAGPAEFADTVEIKSSISYNYNAVYSVPVTVTFDANGAETEAPVAMTDNKYYNANTGIIEGSVEFTVPSDILTKTGYGFMGWSEDKDAEAATYVPGAPMNDIKSDTTLYAVWNDTYHAVVFKNYDGEVLLETNVAYGVMPQYFGTVPAKESDDASTKWVFDGWSPALTEVTGDQEYVATFKTAVADYSVKFVNDDGTVLQETMVDYLGMPEYNGATPEKAADEQYTYTFTGWDAAFAEVTGDQVYTAVYESTINSYIVKFVNYDGTVLQEEELEYGTVPAYSGETPEKAADVQYTYTFAKWDKALTAVTGEQVYVATYKNIVNSYEVKFVNYDGFVLYKANVKYGTKPEYKGDTPRFPEDDTFRHIFNGWTPEITEVTGDAIYTAMYTYENKDVTVTFYDFNGNMLESKYVPFGSVPEYTGATPVRLGTDAVSYVFKGWDKELTNVEGKTSYTAVYEEVVNKYSVVFMNDDGTVLQKETLSYGSMPDYKGETPEKAADDNYEYTFIGWNSGISKVTGNVEYVAVYSQQPISYLVKFVDANGTVLQSKSYKIGETPVYEGEALTKAYTNGYHYEFSGWNKEIVAVTEGAVYTAVYNEIAHEYTEEVISEATCTDAGAVAYSCECGYSKEESVAALGHDYKFVSDDEATYYECTRCGDVVDIELKEPEEIPEEELPEGYCEHCGKYHYKYLIPIIGRYSCFISRVIEYFLSLFEGFKK